MCLSCPVCRPCETTFEWNFNKLDSSVIQSVKEFLFLYVWQEVYSKRMVSLESVDKVVSVGDLRFELHSQSRTFLFRAESTRVYLSMFSSDHLAECLWHIFVFIFRLWMIFIDLYCVCIFTEERNDWVGCIEKILSERKNSLEPRNLFFKSGSVNICFEGNLEMLSPRTKVYTLISRDKLFLFRSHEVWVWMWITVFLNVLGGLFDRLVVFVFCI